MSDGKSYASERQSRYTDGLVEKDIEQYTHDNSKYLTEQVKKGYTEDIATPGTPKRITEELVLERHREIPEHTFHFTEQTESSLGQANPQISFTDTRIAEQIKVSTDDVPLVTNNEPQAVSSIEHRNFYVSTTCDNVNTEAGISYLNHGHSFQASEKEVALRKNSVRDSIEAPPTGEAKSKYSRYFKETSDPTNVVKTKEVSERFAKASTVESQLEKRGVSAYEFISPLADIAKDDDVGGEMIAGVMTTAEKTYNTVHRINKARATATTGKASATASKSAASSATTAQSSGAVAGGTASKAGAKALPVPPIVYLWIFAGVIVTALQMLFFGMLSFAVTQVSFSAGSNEGDVALELTDVETKNSTDLVIWCKTAEVNKEGYVYGAFGQVCTYEYLDQQANMYPGDEEAGGPMRIAGERWLGKRVYDCIGLIKSYGWYNQEADAIEYGTNGMVDFSANTIWDYVEDGDSGEIDDIPEIPGIAVCMDGHIGVYIGNGEVIEAQGTETGVVKTQLENGSWTHWMKIPGIKYPEDEAMVPISPTEPNVPDINTSDPVIVTDPVEH
ncbi:MAG: hypothetical protein UGF89_12235 [Acutalibacteraceae bacterium]|nr:hypothetical protein [Acutalibacteraceae bacterium]